MNAYTVTENNL